MEILRMKPPKAIELSFIIVGNGNKLWHKVYKHPEYGFSIISMDLGSPSVLGYSHGVLPFVNFPFTSFNRKVAGSFKVGSGLSYITKTYHQTYNSNNIAISTHLNALIDIGFEGRYNFRDNGISVRLGFHLTHFSNGTFKKPNAGLNYAQVSLGIAKGYTHRNVSNRLLVSCPENTNRLLFIGSGSFKEVKGAGGPKYYVVTSSLEFTRSISTLWRYGLSLDLMYDESAGFIMDYEGIAYDTNWQILKSGASVNVEFILDRLSAVFYFGKYIQNRSQEGGPFYQRLGLRYRVNDRFFVNLALKTHLNIADYLEVGLGIKVF